MTTDSATATVPGSSRILSMDQFRGYAVAGMFVVNFVGDLDAFPEVMKHHNGHPYFSYADSIMTSFLFAAGFSYRLSALKRFAQVGRARACGHFVVRSLALVLISAGDVRRGRPESEELVANKSGRSLEAGRVAAQGEPLGSARDHWDRADTRCSR